MFVAAPNGDWLAFYRPARVLIARTVEEVPDVLRSADAALMNGAYIAGFVCYEASRAFDSAHETHPPPQIPPLAWFGVFDSPPQRFELQPSRLHVIGRWRAQIGKAEYAAAVGEIRRQIAEGEVYQANLTYRLKARFAGNPLSFFADLASLQPSPHNFFLETEDWAVCSASPECFFQKRGMSLSSMPMKGTRPNLPGEAVRLENAPKDRAENLMIVDMLRNDMSRIPGAINVKAGPLFVVERYPTVLQMTSTVGCETNAVLSELFKAMFPCASVTGAPKIAAMRLIREMESSSRGVYCGSCGWAGQGEANFNVAIRTAFVDKAEGIASYGVGSGIVFDSTAEDEWQECHSKTAILKSPKPDIMLIETMRQENEDVKLLERHIHRLKQSARELGFACDTAKIREAILATRQHQKTHRCLRLTLRVDGTFRLESYPLPAKPDKPISVCFYDSHVRSDDALLRHKISLRSFYEEAARAADAAGCQDAVFVNEKGEVTETCIANVVAKTGSLLLTPPLSCGLLPGVARGEMLDDGELTEAILSPADLRRADAVYRLNALRGLEEIRLIPR